MAARGWWLFAAYLWLALVAVLAYFAGNFHFAALALPALILIAYYARPAIAIVTALIAAFVLPYLDEVVPPRVMLDKRFEPLVLSLVFIAVVYVTDQLRRRTAEAAVLRDRTERAEHAALMDHLTGLANRAAVLEHLERAIARRRESEHIGVLFADLDGFKGVNDTHGHSVGDEILALAAQRLAHALRAEDLIGRVGGDEFAVILHRVKSRVEVQAIADEVERAFAEPFSLDTIGAELGVTVGLAVAPDDGDDAATLLDRADAAMYARKRAKRQVPRSVS